MSLRIIYCFILISVTRLCSSINLCPELSPCVCEREQQNLEFITIDCSRKGLTEIPDFSLLQTNRTVDNIRLFDNKITKIEKNAFAGIKPRDKGPDRVDGGQDLAIILSQNEISHISPNAFDDILSPFNKRLALFLDLGDNKLENLNWMFGVCKADSADIDVHKNPIKCDCKTYNITQYGEYQYSGKCNDEGEYANMYLRYWHPATSSSIVNKETSFGHNARETCTGTSGDEILKYSCYCKKWLPYDKHSELNWECKYPVSSADISMHLTKSLLILGMVISLCFKDTL